jgi:hypothetical protein
VSMEIAAALIGVGTVLIGGQFALWMRFERRMTRLETSLEDWKTICEERCRLAELVHPKPSYRVS